MHKRTHYKAQRNQSREQIITREVAKLEQRQKAEREREDRNSHAKNSPRA